MRNEAFENKLILAPMAGYTDLPFRLLAREYGADITVSEMISAKGLYYKDKKTERLLRTVPEESHYGIQIFGSDPEILGWAAKYLSERNDDPDDILNFQFIDLNAGCPAPKIFRNGDGSALIQDPQKLYQCLNSMVENATVPVTLKTRKGLVKGDNFAPQLAEIAESAGASAVTIHGRTRSEYYSGQADYEAVAEAAAAVDIPVILSGDIRTAEDAKRALSTGASSLMIGRGAVGSPWIFNHIKGALETGEDEIPVGGHERIEAALRHIELTEKYSPEPYAMIEMRKHLASYTKGISNSSKIRTELFKVRTAEEARELFIELDKLI